MRKTTAALMSAIALSAFGSTALAQDEDGMGLSCNDIEFHPDVIAQAADIATACRDVVELNGSKYAKTEVRLDKVRGNRATFHFIYPDGKKGSRHTITVDSDWRAKIDGRDYPMRDLMRGQELSVYLPSDRWEAHLSAPTTSFTSYAPVAAITAGGEDMGGSGSSGGSGAMLPATAGALPLFGLFGGIALLGASLIRIFRRR